MNRLSLILFLFTLFLPSVGAQELSVRMQELEERRKALMESIELTGEQLSEKQQTGIQLLNQLTQISAQVTARKKIIQVIDDEIKKINREERLLNQELISLERSLKAKQDAYANAIRSMYSKSSHMEKFMFLLSAENLSQAYRRARYLKEYTSWRRMQADDIVQKKDEVEAKKEELNKTRKEKLAVLGERQKEANKLAEEESKQKQIIQRVKGEERTLQAELNKKRKQAAELDKQIERIIAQEAERRRLEQQKALAAAKRGKAGSVDEESLAKAKAETKGGFAMTKAELALSSDFASNRGRLPVPISDNRYSLVGRFGQQKHADLKYVTTQSSGIDLQTTPGAEARAVFNGVVSRVFTIPGSNLSVIVRHGNYLTVYSNLSEVYVKAGDKITTRQNLGKIFVDADRNNRTVLHFQLWKDTTKQNPEPWLNL